MKKYERPEIQVIGLADTIMGDVNIGFGSTDHSTGEVGAKDHSQGANSLFDEAGADQTLEKREAWDDFDKKK